MDAGSQPGEAVRAVVAYLDYARSDLEVLSASLHNAATPLFSVGHAESKETAA
ncbi:hypothetical protein ACIGEZ_15845 [Streptomyces sp. NPDC085481]|uniref:hypothetical protein n=1 Tax=Streptomyces sp. NPDC085481 TaxID=3365727 RepID=UPI0037CD1E2D